MALSGTALALQRGEVKSKHIAADAVRSKHIAPNAAGGADVNEASLGQVPAAADSDALSGLGLSEVTGDGRQLAAGSGTVAITGCGASGFWEDSGANAVEAVVELRSGDSTVATTPRYASELDGQPNTRYDVVAVLRNGSNPEIPPGSYTLRVVLDSVPCQVDDGSSQGGARLGYVTIGAR